MTSNNSPEVLLRTIRNNITDCEYYGSYYIADKNGILLSKGYNESELFFIRSLAKPIQAAISADCNILKDFNIALKELAIMTGSHSGTNKHTGILKNLMKNHGLKIKDLELEAINPLDTRKFNGKKTKLHNNCSGKHILMVLMCKYLNIDHKNYTNENHPIQKLIKSKQEILSEEKCNIVSYDGCSTPLWAISAKGIIRAYFNLTKQEKYKAIIDSAIKYPDVFGGYERLDSEIIKLGKGNLYSKVGANGFLIVYNFKEDKIFLLKITQNNNPIRRDIALYTLNKLSWIASDYTKIEYNQKKQPVAKYCYNIDLQ